MEAKVNIGVGKDYKGEFIQHNISIGETTTPLVKQYYKIVDEQLINNMPQAMLVDMVAKGTAELKRRDNARDSK